LVTGACVGFLRGHGLGDLFLFVAASLALFWLRTPIEILAGSSVMRTHSAEERRTVWQLLVALTVGATVPLYFLLRGGRHNGLWIIAGIAGAAFATQAGVKLLGRQMRMPAQIIGAIGLTSTAAGAYYIVTNRLSTTAIALWVVNWLFAGDQIHYVHVRMQGAKVLGARNRLQRGWVFLLAQVVMFGTVLVICLLGYLHPGVVLAFAPVTIRGMLWVFGTKPRLDLHWLGITELLHSITFGVLLITSYYVPR
jgi:hypothetical protein